MKIKELMEKLASLPPDADVYVWIDGDREGISGIDESFLGDEYPFVDINVEV